MISADQISEKGSTPDHAPLVGDQLRILNEALLQIPAYLKELGPDYAVAMHVVRDIAITVKDLAGSEYAKGILRVGKDMLDQAEMKNDGRRGGVLKGLQVSSTHEGYGVLGRAYAEFGDTVEAQRILRELSPGNEGTLQIYAGLAAHFANEGNTKQALHALKAIQKGIKNKREKGVDVIDTADFRDTFIEVAKKFKDSDPEVLIEIAQMLQRVVHVALEIENDELQNKRNGNGDNSFVFQLVKTLARIQFMQGEDAKALETLKQGERLIQEAHDLQDTYDTKLVTEGDESEYPPLTIRQSRIAASRARQLRIVAEAYLEIDRPDLAEELLQRTDLKVMIPNRDKSGTFIESIQGQEEARASLVKWYAEEGNITKAEELLAGKDPKAEEHLFTHAEEAIIIALYKTGEKYELHTRLNKASSEVKRDMGEYFRIQEAIGEMGKDQNFHRFAGWRGLEVAYTEQRINRDTGNVEDYIADPLGYARALVTLVYLSREKSS